jgi:sugar lactone lactonase YvrE
MISLHQISFLGSELHRPECVLCTRAGNVYTSDWRGGVTKIDAQGNQTAFLAQNLDFELKPNGIALLPDGSFLIAHLGPETGGVYHLTREGVATPYVTPTNYVHYDPKGRVWITVSTSITPRAKAYRGDIADGFILVKDGDGVRLAADQLGYTNECLVHPTGKWLYVNETFGRKLSRFLIDENGSLHSKEIMTQFGAGVFPDGLTFAEDGSIFVTSIVSNRVVQIDETGHQEIWLEDCETDHMMWVEEAFQKGEMDRPHLDHVKSQRLQNISSLAFGGEDLRTAYLGCLLGEQIAYYHSNIAGLPPVHWEFDA